jgi:hypothetical protein
MTAKNVRQDGFEREGKDWNMILDGREKKGGSKGWKSEFSLITSEDGVLALVRWTAKTLYTAHIHNNINIISTRIYTQATPPPG